MGVSSNVRMGNIDQARAGYQSLAESSSFDEVCEGKGDDIMCGLLLYKRPDLVPCIQVGAYMVSIKSLMQLVQAQKKRGWRP